MREKDMWGLLEIEPTNDQKQIRRAYAQQAKVHHLEEDPQAFAELNRAYQQALQYAKQAGGGSAAKAGRPEKAGFPENAEYPEKTGLPEKANHPEKTELPEKANHPEKTGLPEKANYTEKTGLPEKANYPEKTGFPGKVNHPEKAKVTEPPENLEKKPEDSKKDVPESLNGNQQGQTSDEFPFQEEAGKERRGFETSLLARLAQAEQKAMESSRKEGALGKLIALTEDEKNARKAGAWRDYFLSEDFLNEQFDEAFGKGLWQFMKEAYFDLQNPDSQEPSPPRPLILELAIAYGLHPDSFGEVNGEGSFYNRAIAGRLWNICSSAWDFPEEATADSNLNPKDFRVQDSPELMEKLMKSRLSGPGRMLMRRENLVRLRSFSDYLTLHTMNQKGYLTEKEQEVWAPILDCGQVNHLYEQAGGQAGGKAIYPETRSTCLPSLYAHWIRTEPVPDCVCKYIYRKYDLKNLEHSSRKDLYLPLKAALLKRCPAIEAELFHKDSKEQMIRTWYQELMHILSDYHSSYDRREYSETEEIRSRIEALFQRREWKTICHEPELFDKMMLQLASRRVIPETLAQKLSAFYEEDYPWPRPEDVLKMQEGLVISMAFHRNLLETDYRYPQDYEKTKLSDIRMDNRDFWEYFLMTGFGCRSFTSVTSRQNTGEYVRNNEWSLPAYMQAIYMPSMRWRKKFTGFDQEENRILSPKSLIFTLPDGRSFRAEFHLHYIHYFIQEKPVIYPAFTFEEWKKIVQNCSENQLAKEQNQLTKEQCFILLAAVSICEEERMEAEGLILTWLKKLPLAPVTLPVLAKMLSADHAWPPAPENEARRIQGIFYEEQERFCFKAEVGMRSIKTYRKTNWGWEDLPLLPGEGKAAKALDLDGKKQFALQKLHSLRQPKPVLLASYPLDGMESVEKMRRILDALKEQEQYRKAKKRTVPYSPGWPWSPEEITPAVRKFFSEDGGWMLESYVLLQMGSRKNPCFERIFYSKMSIFGFDLSFQSPEFVGSLNSRTSALSQKIKEKHLIVGHFGWGKAYEARKSFAPMPFAVGESGSFYAYDFLRLYKAATLEELMAKLFDFSEVSRVDVYAGRLSVSRLDHELEYCYTEEDFQNYLDSKTKTLPDIFTKFGI